MNTQRFGADHFSTEDQSESCSLTSKVTDWIHEAAEKSPTAVCLASFAVGIGVGALLVHGMRSASENDMGSSLKGIGKRALDSLMDALPTNLAQTVQSRFQNGFSG